MCGPRWGHHSSEGRMAEQTSTENQRPPLYRVFAGSILKGARVEILGTPEVKVNQLDVDALRPTARVWVREVLDYRLNADQQLREATVLWRNLERVFRTPQETELGRDFTEAEAAEYERQDQAEGRGTSGEVPPRCDPDEVGLHCHEPGACGRGRASRRRAERAL